MSNRIESGLLRCRECRREIQYCCESTVLAAYRHKKVGTKHIANADRYYPNRTVSGFLVVQQREQLLKQKYICALCGRPAILVIDKVLAEQDKRLRFICRPCLAAIKKVRSYDRII